MLTTGVGLRLSRGVGKGGGPAGPSIISSQKTATGITSGGMPTLFSGVVTTAGHRLLVLCASKDTNSFTGSGDWTKVHQGTNPGSLALFTKISTGNDTFAASGPARTIEAVFMEVKGSQESPLPGNMTFNTSGTRDPPSHTMTAGDTLVLAAMNGTATVMPTDYTEVQQHAGFDGGGIIVASRSMAGLTTENPSVFSGSVGGNGLAVTIFIR